MESNAIQTCVARSRLGAAALPAPAKIGQVEIGVCGSVDDFEKAEQFGFDYFEPAVAAVAALSERAFADFEKRVAKSRLVASASIALFGR